jgi:hypothetical protein
MRLIDRLQEYLKYSHISAYTFEHSCGLSNGYLGKQLKGKGAVGSDILERIKEIYVDLSIVWLVTGKGHMLLSLPKHQQSRVENISEMDAEEAILSSTKDEMVKLLKRQVEQLETMVADKDKIISLMEENRYATMDTTRQKRIK